MVRLGRFQVISDSIPRRVIRPLAFLLLQVCTILVFTACLWGGMLEDRRQIASLSIFCGVIWGILIFEEHRLMVGAVAVAMTLALRLFSSAGQFFSIAGLPVILFLLGTFLLAGYLEQSGFFEHLAGHIIRHVGRRPQILMAVLMLSAMIASAIVGEVAAILFVGGAMLHIAQRYKLQPIPFLIMLVFATNSGSASSPFGPVGVTIALKAKLGVADFFRWATPTALIVLGLVFVICRWWFAPAWVALAQAVHAEEIGSSVNDSVRRSHTSAWILTAMMTALFVFHGQVERLVGFGANVVLPASALTVGGIALLFSRSGAKEVIQKRVDWATLGFFFSLFVVVGALEVTGVTGVIAQQLMHRTGGRPAALVLAVGWSTGVLTALLDNLLAVATFLPIVADLKSRGVHCPDAVYWLMLFGGTFMGNMTSIGSTCNIIACGMAEKRGHGTIYFRSWLKIGLIVSLSSMLLATFLLAIQTRWFSTG